MTQGKFQSKYDWTSFGSKIVFEYKAGESPLTLSAKYKIPKGAIASYLGRQGVRRTKKQAKRIERLHQRRRRFAPRTCRACNEPYTPSGPTQRYCKLCIPNTQSHRRYSTKGVSKKDWDRICKAQGGTCALCPNPPRVADHDHTTLVVRGLLCGGCNQALNRVEWPGWATRARAYLKRDVGCRANPTFQARYNKNSAPSVL